MSVAMRNLWRVLYAATAKWMPQNLYFKPSKALRQFFAHRICESAGTHLDIEKGFTFTAKVIAGNRSDIGMHSELHGHMRTRNGVVRERCSTTTDASADVLVNSNVIKGSLGRPLNHLQAACVRQVAKSFPRSTGSSSLRILEVLFRG